MTVHRRVYRYEAGERYGFIVLGVPLLVGNSRQINDLTRRNGRASAWPIRDGADAGGLMSYGANVLDLVSSGGELCGQGFQGSQPRALGLRTPRQGWRGRLR